MNNNGALSETQKGSSAQNNYHHEAAFLITPPKVSHVKAKHHPSTRRAKRTPARRNKFGSLLLLLR
jgi:hypothetical protein